MSAKKMVAKLESVAISDEAVTRFSSVRFKSPVRLPKKHSLTATVRRPGERDDDGVRGIEWRLGEMVFVMVEEKGVFSSFEVPLSNIAQAYRA